MAVEDACLIDWNLSGYEGVKLCTWHCDNHQCPASVQKKEFADENLRYRTVKSRNEQIEQSVDQSTFQKRHEK
jgi:hypothetical protein